MIQQMLRSVVGPSAPPDFDPDTVTPGVIGFLLTFFVAAAVVLLVLDMTRRIRRVRYRAEVGDRLDEEETERAAAEREEADRVIRHLDPDRDTSDDGDRR